MLTLQGLFYKREYSFNALMFCISCHAEINMINKNRGTGRQISSACNADDGGPINKNLSPA